MASAIIGGLIAAGHSPESLLVIEPHVPQSLRLRQRFGVQVDAVGGTLLGSADVAIWAVKPQAFDQAAATCAPFLGDALHLSIMAGIRSDAITLATGSEKVVRAMPNTPAIIGEGIAGLYACAAVTDEGRSMAEALLAPTGETLFVPREADLDAITALSGSGPAYVFYFLEAMVQAAVEMGLDVEKGHRLAMSTFKGATALALISDQSLEALRNQVTSKGGTTHAALAAMESSGVKAAIVAAIRTAQARACELSNIHGRQS